MRTLYLLVRNSDFSIDGTFCGDVLLSKSYEMVQPTLLLRRTARQSSTHYCTDLELTCRICPVDNKWWFYIELCFVCFYGTLNSHLLNTYVTDHVIHLSFCLYVSQAARTKAMSDHRVV